MKERSSVEVIRRSFVFFGKIPFSLLRTIKCFCCVLTDAGELFGKYQIQYVGRYDLHEFYVKYKI